MVLLFKQTGRSSVVVQRTMMLRLFGSSPGGYILLYFGTLLYPCCVVTRSKSHWKSHFEAYLWYENRLVFSQKNLEHFWKNSVQVFLTKFRLIPNKFYEPNSRNFFNEGIGILFCSAPIGFPGIYRRRRNKVLGEKCKVEDGHWV
jgi:hypothetical protein